MTSPLEATLKAETFARQNLPILASEIIQWDRKMVLPETARLRKLAQILRVVASTDVQALSLARTAVVDAALGFAAAG